MIRTQTIVRIFTVSLAVAVGARLHVPVWSLVLAVLAVGGGLVLEHRRAAQRAAHPFWPSDAGLAPEPGPAQLAARVYPIAVLLLSLAAWLLSRSQPELCPPAVALALLVLVHNTSFSELAERVWPLAACRLGEAWRTRVGVGLLYRLCGATTVVLPRRGVLTRHRPRVAQVEALEDDVSPEDVLRIAAAILRGRPDPLTAALQQAAQRTQLAVPAYRDVWADPRGGWATQQGEQEYLLGGLDLVAALGCALGELRDEVNRRQVEGGDVLFLFIDERLSGLLALHDTWRKEAGALIQSLRHHGVERVAVMSSSDPLVADTIRRVFGLDEVLPCGDPARTVEAIKAWSTSGPVAVMAQPEEHAAALAAADLAVGLTAAGEQPNQPYDLTLQAVAPSLLARPWQVARRARRNEQVGTKVRWAWHLAVAALAVAGVPLGLILLIDELVVLFS